MNISQFYCSEKLDKCDVEIVVTLPTFRRPEQVLLTLQSLKDQNLSQSMAVIVMDNDSSADGAKSCADFMREHDLPGLVIIAHDRGNCHAYNAGWTTALAEFRNFKWLAVIDDDEIADKNWLSNHIQTAVDTQAHFVGGPQIQQFPDNTPSHWRNHPVFQPHYTKTGPVPILYSSGNVIIAREVLDQMPAPFLDTAFNFIGGGDSDFYQRSKAQGFTFAWCNEAPVFEDVPERRATFSWINARSLRNGSISAIIETRDNKQRAKTIFKSFVLLGLSPVRAVKLAIEKRSIFIGLYHIQVALGRLMAEFGVVNEQYRNPEAN